MSTGATHRRDSQQWILDWMARTTGTDRNFGVDHELWPRNVVRSVKMVPKVMGKIAAEQERLAAAAYDHGAPETARSLYIKAAGSYRVAQHALMENTAEKRSLWEALDRCYDRVIETAVYPIERVEIPWEGVTFPGLMHYLPDRRRAPTVLFVPGMDMTKEQLPDPERNIFTERGFNVLVIDGPGQGASNVRGIWVTDDNYERAGTAAIDWLAARPEVDESRISVVGISMGSFWAPRIAAHDPRVHALVAAMGCYGDKSYIFEKDSPHFKQMFMYMAGMVDEDEFDRMAERMVLTGHMDRVTCPTLLATGEFDPLSPLEQAYEVLEELTVPRELWIFADEAHRLLSIEALSGMSLLPWALDWIRGVESLSPDHTVERYIERGGTGPVGAPRDRPGQPWTTQ